VEVERPNHGYTLVLKPMGKDDMGVASRTNIHPMGGNKQDWPERASGIHHQPEVVLECVVCVADART
jgi:hypothetical protein